MQTELNPPHADKCVMTRLADLGTFQRPCFWVRIRRPKRALAFAPSCREEAHMKKGKKLTLSKETLRTLDERDLSLVVGGDSGAHEPPHGGPNSCPNTKDPGCK
jgi:natural product precursor